MPKRDHQTESFDRRNTALPEGKGPPLLLRMSLERP